MPTCGSTGINNWLGEPQHSGRDISELQMIYKDGRSYRFSPVRRDAGSLAEAVCDMGNEEAAGRTDVPRSGFKIRWEQLNLPSNRSNSCQFCDS